MATDNTKSNHMTTDNTKIDHKSPPITVSPPIIKGNQTKIYRATTRAAKTSPSLAQPRAQFTKTPPKPKSEKSMPKTKNEKFDPITDNVSSPKTTLSPH